LLVLGQVQAIYGMQNTQSKVFFSGDDAAIFAEDPAGVMRIFVVLTNLAAWLADGTIASIDELRNDWLRGGSAPDT
jgi:hypothetical protein